jgi:hypothetical protein
MKQPFGGLLLLISVLCFIMAGYHYLEAGKEERLLGLNERGLSLTQESRNRWGADSFENRQWDRSFREGKSETQHQLERNQNIVFISGGIGIFCLGLGMILIFTKE